MEPFDSFDELSACSYLFLEHLIEPDVNRLRIRVVEGQVTNMSVPVEVAGNPMGEGFPVEVTPASMRFELVWQSHVLYQVTNESYGAKDQLADGIFKGSIGVYTSSILLNQVPKMTNASGDYPGKLVHYRITCSDHIINVVSTEKPECRRIRPQVRVN